MEKQFFDLLLLGYKTLGAKLAIGPHTQDYQRQRELSRLSDATAVAISRVSDQLRIYRVFSDSDGILTDAMLSDAARIKALMPQLASVDTRGVGDASVFFLPQARALAVGDAAFSIVESEIGTTGTYAATAGVMLAQMRSVRNIPLKVISKNLASNSNANAFALRSTRSINLNIGGGSIVGSRFENEIFELATKGELALPVMSRDFSIRHLMADVTAVTGNEVGLFRLANGSRVLRMGGPDYVEVGSDVTRVIGHTHPSGILQFSSADIFQLNRLGQRSSVIIDPVSTAGARVPVR